MPAEERSTKERSAKETETGKGRIVPETSLKLKVGSQNRVFEYSDAGTSRYITGQRLADCLSGLNAKSIIRIRFLDENLEMYTEYRGGKMWVPTVAPELATKRGVLRATVIIPSIEAFLARLPPFDLVNELGIRWMAETVHFWGFDLVNNSVQVHVSQDPDVCGVGNFVISGDAPGDLQFDKGRAYLDFRVSDAFGGSRSLRVYHDGSHVPELGIQSGGEFCPVFCASSDGFRLRLAYRDYKFNPHVATIYTADPSVLYELGEMFELSSADQVEVDFRMVEIRDVKIVREFENTILRVGTTYDVGRLGAEIAYATSRQKLGISDTTLVEPSQPGVDLYSAAANAVIQARMLVQAHYGPHKQMSNLVRDQLYDVLKSVYRDLRRISSSTNGYAILSFTNSDWITKTLVLTVQRRNLSHSGAYWACVLKALDSISAQSEMP